MESHQAQRDLAHPHFHHLEKLTCLCLISSFFCSRKAEGMPAMFSWALSSRGQRSFINSRAFFPFRKPVRLICIILLSGCCNTHTKGGEKKKKNIAIEILEDQTARGGRVPQTGLPTFYSSINLYLRLFK